MLKMNIFAVLRIFIFLCIIWKSIQISPAAVDVLLKGIEVVNEKTKSIFNSLANDNDITAEDVVIAYLEQIPVVGTLVTFITGGQDDEVNKKLDEIQNQLNDFSNQLKIILTFTENIKLKIEFLATNIIISSASSTINSCSRDRNNFLLKPKSQQAKDRILRDACSHDIMDPIRQIIRILKEEKFSLDSPKLFKYMVNSDGSCDGPTIESTYDYLFGLVLDGCRTAIITEEIRYNGTSKITLSECKREASFVSTHYKTIFNRCLQNQCDGVHTKIENSVKEIFDRPVKEQRKTLSTLFPWFHFLLAKFIDNPDFKIIGDHPLSEIQFQKGDNYLIILWASYANTWNICGGTSTPNERFMAATFNSTVLDEVSVGLNVTINSSTNPGNIRSCVTKKTNDSYIPCPSKKIRLKETTSGSFSRTPGKLIFFVAFLLYIVFLLKE